MIEEIMIWHLLECVDHLSLTLTLYLENVGNLKIAHVIVSTLNVSSVVNISTNHFILWALDIKRINHQVHSLIYVVDGIRLLLSQESTQQNLRGIFNVSEGLKQIILSFDLMLVVERWSNLILEPLKRNKLVVAGR